MKHHAFRIVTILCLVTAGTLLGGVQLTDKDLADR